MNPHTGLDSITLPVLGPESCTGCGHCCEGIGSPVAIYASRRTYSEEHPFRPAGLPAELIAEIDEHFAGLVRGQEPQERCLWFDPALRQCRHYEFRPPLCREYELGGRACLALRRDRGVSLSSPVAPRQESHLITDA